MQKKKDIYIPPPGSGEGHIVLPLFLCQLVLDRVAQSVGHLTRKSGVLGSIPSLAKYFRFSFR